MNKYILSLVMCCLLIAACDSNNDPLADLEADMRDVTIFTVAEDNSIQSRAGELGPTSEMPTRYLIQYSDRGGTIYRATSTDGNFNLKLKYGEEYTCLFWADNGKGYDATDLRAVSISSQPDMAAYSGATAITAGVSNQDSYTVILQHAVARVDLYQKSDFARASGKLSMKSDKRFSLDVSTGATAAIEADVDYEFGDIKQESAGKCIAVAYYIAPAEDAVLSTLTFSMQGEDTENSVSNVPLRQNYVTQVTGNFSDLYNSNIDVSIYDNWQSTYNVELWDGVSTSVPEDYARGETLFYITNPRELAWLAQESGKEGKTFEGYTIYIDRDIYLNNMEWTPIGLNSKGFKGRIVGQGYRINGLKINSVKNGNVGLFASLTEGSKISQLDVYGEISLNSPAEESCIGGIAGKMADSDLFSIHSYVKINVTNGQSGNVGGLIGSALDCDLFSIYTCADISVAGSRMNVGGAIGVYTAKNFSKSSSILNAIYHESGTVSASGGQYNNVGGIVGFFRGDNTNDVSIDACYNRAPVTVSNSKGSICGGLIGSCSGYTASKLEIWACENTTTPEVSQSSDAFYGEIVGQAQVSGGYTLKLTQPRINGTIVIGRCYISDDNSQILYNSNPFTGDNGSSIYR